MRKQLCLVGIFSLFLLGLASCSQDETAPQDPKGTGSVKINFLGFAQTPKSRVGTPVNNTKRPVTSWKNVKNGLMILFVSGDKVLDAREITPPAATDMSSQSETFNQVPAMNNGKIYIIANSDAGVRRLNNEIPDTPISWSSLTVKNMNFPSLYLQLNDASTTTELPADTQKYNQPSEIFIASQENVTITADQTTTLTTPLDLTRAVSLIRVRLNPVGLNATACKFAGADAANAFVYIRKVNPSLWIKDGSATNHRDISGIFVPKPFESAEPTTGYTGSDPILDTTWKYYQDIISFPGGGTASTDKFEVVIKGIATANYIYPNGHKANVGDPVYFSGPFDMKATPNDITIVNVTVNSQGTPNPPAPGQTFGKLDISVDVKDWGNVTTGDITV